MVGSRVALAVILGVAVVACATSPGPSQPRVAVPSGSPQITNLPDGPSPVAATATPSAPSPTPVARPTLKPTPLAVPPRPTGVKLHEESEAICGDDPREMCAIGDSIYTVSWKAPRTKGVEIRVYGVTTCFGVDGSGRMIDGDCLRQHTEVPASVRVLLAKAPASKGKVTWRMEPAQSLAQTRDGVPVYSFVLATYNAEGGHSIFAIADAGDYCTSADVECPD